MGNSKANARARPPCIAPRTGAMRIKMTFGIADLLIATAFIGAGIAILMRGFGMPFGSPRVNDAPLALYLLCLFSGPTSIGAGVGSLFKRPIRGAVSGFLTMAILAALFLLLTDHC